MVFCAIGCFGFSFVALLLVFFLLDFALLKLDLTCFKVDFTRFKVDFIITRRGSRREISIALYYLEAVIASALIGSGS